MTVFVTGTDASVATDPCPALGLESSTTGWPQALEMQFMDAQSIVEAEAGLARGVCFALLFALPLWVAIASIAVVLAG